MRMRHQNPYTVEGLIGQEGTAEGTVFLHEPNIIVANPVADDVDSETARLHAAMDALRAEVDNLLKADYVGPADETRDVMQAYRMFAHPELQT